MFAKKFSFFGNPSDSFRTRVSEDIMASSWKWLKDRWTTTFEVIMESSRAVRAVAQTWAVVLLAGWLSIGGWSLSSFCCRTAWGQSSVKAAGSFLIPAYAYDRGIDVVACTAATSRYVDAEPMVGNLRYPTHIEYDIDFRSPPSTPYISATRLTAPVRFSSSSTTDLSVWPVARQPAAG